MSVNIVIFSKGIVKKAMVLNGIIKDKSVRGAGRGENSCFDEENREKAWIRALSMHLAINEEEYKNVTDPQNIL